MAKKTTAQSSQQARITIVNYDVKKLITMLNQAYADEWIAHYQYWLCAKLVRGPIRAQVIPELIEHATQELNHATMIADRIIQLDGQPLLTPEAWKKHAGCGYDATKNAYVRAVLEENIKGERCAIQTYNNILSMVETKDPITYDMILKILQDEVKHEEDLVRLLEDLDTMES